MSLFVARRVNTVLFSTAKSVCQLYNKSNIYQRGQVSLFACHVAMGGGCDHLQHGCISWRSEVIGAAMTNTQCSRPMRQAHCAKPPGDPHQVGAVTIPHLQDRN